MGKEARIVSYDGILIDCTLLEGIKALAVLIDSTIEPTHEVIHISSSAPRLI